MRPRDLEALEFPRVREALAAFATSQAGRKACLALRPSADPEQAQGRLERTWQLHRFLLKEGELPLGEAADLPGILARAAPAAAVLGGEELWAVCEALTLAAAVRARLKRAGGCYPLVVELGERIPRLPELAALLRRALEPGGQLRDEASPALAGLRAALRMLRAELERRLQALIAERDVASAVAEPYVTVRNGRFVVPLKAGFTHVVPGVVQDRSASGETYFVEPLFAVELNNRLLITQRDEEAEQRRILGSLTAAVRTAAGALATLASVLAEVDMLAAASRFARALGATRPELGADEVALSGARHPLLGMGGRKVVPIDLLVPAQCRGLAITGPNTGGKTVALKTLGLLACMAQSGLLIPAAQGSRLPVFDNILADIGDEQSIGRALSTFSAHLENLVEIARLSTPRSLVLLDEPGVGTDPVEGGALAVGLLTYLASRGPRVVFTSHHTQVKSFALAERTYGVAAVDFDPTQGLPRYRLRYDTLGPSLGLAIARNLGFPEAALEAAERVLGAEARDLRRAVERLEESRRAFDKEREVAAAERASAQRARAEAEALREELAERKRRRWREELAEARAFVRRIEEQGRQVLAELKRRPEPQVLVRFVRTTEDAIAARETEALGAADSSAAPPHIGDTVEVAGHGLRGELVELSGERARIRRGGMHFEVPAARLRRVVAAPAPRAAEPRVEVAAPEEEIGDELVLLGLKVAEAIPRLEHFLDRALRAGRARVRIVHGFGTGALRRAVEEHLAALPYCVSFRRGEPAEGGAGVTVAELAV